MLRAVAVSMKVLAAAVLCVAMSHAQADPIELPASQNGADQAKIFACGEKSLQQSLAFLAAPIKSQADLKDYLRANKGEWTPLDMLSRDAKSAFLASLRFNDKGLTTFRMDVLEHELSVSEVYQLLAMFGAQRTVGMMRGAKIENDFDREIFQNLERDHAAKAGCGGGDHKFYECIRRATCSKNSSNICLASC